MFESRNGRTINFYKPVKVYRNLHRNGPYGEPIYSIQQGGLVVGYSDSVTVAVAEFVIQKAGQAKVRATGKKVVHAFMTGYPYKVEYFFPGNARSATYNPYRNDTFVDRETGTPVHTARIAKASPGGIHYLP